MEISHSVKPQELTVIYKEDIHLIKSSQQAQLFQERSSYTSVKSYSTIPKGIMGVDIGEQALLRLGGWDLLTQKKLCKAAECVSVEIRMQTHSALTSNETAIISKIVVLKARLLSDSYQQSQSSNNLSKGY